MSFDDVIFVSCGEKNEVLSGNSRYIYFTIVNDDEDGLIQQIRCRYLPQDSYGHRFELIVFLNGKHEKKDEASEQFIKIHRGSNEQSLTEALWQRDFKIIKDNIQGQNFYQKIGAEKRDFIDVYSLQITELLGNRHE